MKKYQASGKKNRAWLLSLVAASLIVSACGQDGGQNTTNNNANNNTGSTTVEQTAGGPEEIYAQSCANCHGGNLQGSYGPGLEKIGSKYSQEEILNIIQNGIGTMPSQAHIAQEDQQKLAEWLAEKK